MARRVAHDRTTRPTRIRPMRAADVRVAAALWSSHDGTNASRARRVLELQLGADDLRLWVADAGTVIGYARVAKRPERRGWPAGWYLAGIVVAPRSRGRGVGTRLTRVRMRWLHGRARRAYFVVNASNEASKRLHANLGFTLVRELRSSFFRGGRGELWSCRLRA